MSTNNIILYLRIDPSSLSSPDTWSQIRQLGEVTLGKQEGEVTELPMGGKHGKLIITKGPNDSHASVRVYDEGLITIDVQHYIPASSSNHLTIDMADLSSSRVFRHTHHGPGQQLSEEYIRMLEQKIRALMGSQCKEINSIYCPVKRGQRVWPYAVTADERLMELDYDDVLVDEQSRWQQVRILHSKRFGNVLLLDGDLMLGECDFVYTETVCGIGRYDYSDKEVLILGGGDGGILYELLQQQPRHITMAEIDETVIQACRKHMRTACHDAMDNYEGPRHKILITDCVQYLHDCIQQGKQFDFVINDLTEFPVDKSVKGYGYDFETTSMITEMSIKAVKPGGKLLARGNCMTAVEYREKIEQDIRTMGCEFIRKEKFVPSFEEVYSFYEIWREGEAPPPPIQNGGS